MQKLPLGNGSGEKLVVKYPSDGGYSPGDTWDVYVGADGRVQKPSVVIAPWTDYKSKADDMPVHIFFSNVAVKVTGSENWINAQ